MPSGIRSSDKNSSNLALTERKVILNIPYVLLFFDSI
jgi:hypothetical protein